VSRVSAAKARAEFRTVKRRECAQAMSSYDTDGLQIVEGRECGSCSLCCKLIAVSELNKPEGIWCSHCAPGKGRCLIYNSRPTSCRGFHCGWLQSDEFGQEWMPTTSKMVIAAEGDGNRITIYVDPGFPTNWRKQPYYSQLQALAIRLSELQTQLLIRINDRVIVLLPNKEVDLGHCSKDDQLTTFRNNRTGEWGARLVAAKDVPPDQRGQWITQGWK
jgi:hypothetical protein